MYIVRPNLNIMNTYKLWIYDLFMESLEEAVPLK